MTVAHEKGNPMTQEVVLTKWLALIAKDVAETQQELATQLDEMAGLDEVSALSGPVALRAAAVVMRQAADSALMEAPAAQLFEELGALVASCENFRESNLAAVRALTERDACIAVLVKALPRCWYGRGMRLECKRPATLEIDSGELRCDEHGERRSTLGDNSLPQADIVRRLEEK